MAGLPDCNASWSKSQLEGNLEQWHFQVDQQRYLIKSKYYRVLNYHFHFDYSDFIRIIKLIIITLLSFILTFPATFVKLRIIYQ